MKSYKIFLCAMAFSLFGAGFGTAQAADPVLWQKKCVDDDNSKTCHISQEVLLAKKNEQGKEQIAGRLLTLSVFYRVDPTSNENQPFLNIRVPLNVDLRLGTALQIDDGKEHVLPFLRCTKIGCETLVRLEPEVLQSLKAGLAMKVGYQPFGTKKPLVIQASLKGFTKAFNGLN